MENNNFFPHLYRSNMHSESSIGSRTYAGDTNEQRFHHNMNSMESLNIIDPIDPHENDFEINISDSRSADSSSGLSNTTDRNKISIYNNSVSIAIDEEPSLVSYINGRSMNKINIPLYVSNKQMIATNSTIEEPYSKNMQPHTETDIFGKVHIENILNDIYDGSNSPLTMSNENSENESDFNDNENNEFIDNILNGNYEIGHRDDRNDRNDRDDRHHVGNHVVINHQNADFGSRAHKDKTKQHEYKILSYKDIEKTIDKYYECDDKQSSEVDILLTYLRGQKNIYIQSKNVAQYKLNILMIPTIIFTATIAVIAPFIQNYDWSGLGISAINAITAMFITLIRYFKMESSVEIYMNIAKQYDHLESSLELTSNKLLFLDEGMPDKKLLDKIRDIEKKLSEIKENTSILIPYEIKMIFPIICNINIFSFIKRIETNKKNIMMKFKDVKNEIRYIVHRVKKMQQQSNDVALQKREHKRLEYLLETKHKIKDELLNYKNAYNYIDHLFTREIKKADSVWIFWRFCNKKLKKPHISNPIIDEYLEFIFIDE